MFPTYLPPYALGILMRSILFYDWAALGGSTGIRKKITIILGVRRTMARLLRLFYTLYSLSDWNISTFSVTVEHQQWLPWPVSTVCRPSNTWIHLRRLQCWLQFHISRHESSLDGLRAVAVSYPHLVAGKISLSHWGHLTGGLWNELFQRIRSKVKKGLVKTRLK